MSIEFLSFSAVTPSEPFAYNIRMEVIQTNGRPIKVLASSKLPNVDLSELSLAQGVTVRELPKEIQIITTPWASLDVEKLTSIIADAEAPSYADTELSISNLKGEGWKFSKVTLHTSPLNKILITSKRIQEIAHVLNAPIVARANSLDEAHQKLFSVVKKIKEVLKDGL